MSLVAKLADVMKAVERIPKNGHNSFHNYDYATEADIAAAIRKELASRQVMLIPAIVAESRHPVGEKGSVLTVLEMEMEFLDGESAESIKKPWRGYGTDKEDKGGYKAMTGGEKYFLLKTFLMPTGDDPEAESPTYTEQGNVQKPDGAGARIASTQPVDDGRVYVKTVDSRPTKKAGVTRYTITLTNQLSGSTIKEALATFAQKAIKDHVPVIATFKDGQYGTDITSLFRAADAPLTDTNGHGSEPPAYLDEPPF